MDPRLHASNELILPLAQLALSCTAIPTSLRPQMRNVVAELESLRSMHVGKLADRHSCRIDQVLPGEMGKTLDERIAEIDVPFLDSPVSEEDHSPEQGPPARGRRDASREGGIGEGWGGEGKVKGERHAEV